MGAGERARTPRGRRGGGSACVPPARGPAGGGRDGERERQRHQPVLAAARGR